MASRHETSSSTRFLNVDLDIYSPFDLGPLVQALGRKVAVLHAGRVKRTYRAHLELAGFTKNADAAIRAFCSLIARLDSDARELWNKATHRDFNIGVEAGFAPRVAEFVLAADTVKAAAELGARIVVTVYAAPTAEPHEPNRK